MRARTLIGLASLAAAGVAAWFVASNNRFANPQALATPPRTIPITDGKSELKDVPVYVSGVGAVQAYNTVSVKSRVDGQITKVLFKEGQDIKAGDPLFQIDPRPFQAALDQAVATKQKDEAQLKGAELDLERYRQLVGQGFQTRQSFEDQQATVGQLHGMIKADQAQIESAQLNLDYALVRAPIDGRTGQRLVDIGNFIQANQTTNLVTITQLKPIFVSFTLAQDVLDELRQNQIKAPLVVEAVGSDDKSVLATGGLTLIDNQVDVSTGTIHLKATFANAEERLWPGEFVTARLTLSVRQNAVTVPAQTVMRGENGTYVYVIKADDTVTRRAVKVAMTQDNLAVIENGLGADEHLVVEGQYRLSEGAKVRYSTRTAVNAAP
ncbi:MAG TPA: efflux RND transporter periplasmic adaptor subunit [Xanthobacteraceae bacterium]|nr:efflux RND transporter periplasmic adaptor subunit [Xanthobacteraceae bacterium]